MQLLACLDPELGVDQLPVWSSSTWVNSGHPVAGEREMSEAAGEGLRLGLHAPIS